MQNNFNVILKDKHQQVNKLKLKLNNLFLSSVTNLRNVRCWSQGGLLCSIRNYHNYQD